MDTQSNEEALTVEQLVFGTLVQKLKLPLRIITQINDICDGHESLPPYNDYLVGKIANEFLLRHVFPDELKEFFLGLFKGYLASVNKEFYPCDLDDVWYNDMRANEYNPFHFHRSRSSDLGLSSVLMLKRPENYGEEYSMEDTPRNGYLSFMTGARDPLAVSMFSIDAQVGDFFIFPYSMLHGVYPFNGTNEVRRTLSYNCNVRMDKNYLSADS